MKDTQPKTRFAVLIEEPQLDTSYSTSGCVWELSVVRVDPAKEDNFIEWAVAAVQS